MSAPSATNAEGGRHGLGIACMLAGAFCLATMDTLAKWLGSDYALAQLVAGRSLFAIPPILVLAHLSGGMATLKTRRPGLHLFRGVLMTLSVYGFFAGLRHMPLADAWAIVFTAPLIITALSPVLLKDPVGWRRWTAVATGFAGVVLVVRPGLGAFQPASGYVLLAALGYALNFLLSRRYAAGESTAVNVLYIMLVSLAVSAALLPGQWRPPEGLAWVLFPLMGLFGGSAMLFLTQAFRIAPAPVVAPFDYSAMIWAVLWGWVLWNDWPDAATWAGTALIVGAGIYVGQREARRPRAAPDAAH